MYLNIHPENPEGRKIQHVIEALEKGDIIIYPTDSVYAFGCDINNKNAIEQMAKIKGIKPNKAKFSIVCEDMSQVSSFVKPMERSVYKVMNKAFPGPYTFILNASTNVPKLFGNKRKDIGVRIPNHPISTEIVKALGRPLVTTSLHDDDEFLEYTTDPDQIEEKYRHDVPVIIDGGMGNIEASTVVDCTNNNLDIVREGIGEIFW